MSGRKERKINAARICKAISRIGYTPASAICDIVDNAVSHHATEIHIKIIKKNNSYNDNKKNNVEEYLIIDNGDGMSLEVLDNALDLGSLDVYYDEGTLSKFGLGLKSASFSQGNRLEVISGDGDEINKELIDIDEIEKANDGYFCIYEDIGEEDARLIKDYFIDGKKGTIVRIKKLNGTQPSIKDVINELKEKIGVIYYYFLNEGLRIFIDTDGNPVEIPALDPLFVDEAGENNLDENEWDGKTVQWILRPQEILLDSENGVLGNIEITMLPHPKVRKNEGITDVSIRTKYHISAQNYGFYVYRNKRLIDWANKLDIIPLDQDYYAFRGRINIDSSADDAFNIDVSKSHISLSEEAKNSLDDEIAEYKRKCKEAWNNAFAKYSSLISMSSNEQTNNILAESDYLDSDMESVEDTEKYKEREAAIEKNTREKAVEEAKKVMQDNGKQTSNEELSEIIVDEIMTESHSPSSLDKVFRVTSIIDNKLWEPYIDAEKKECVRISKTHRFSQLIYENNNLNSDLQVLFELFLYIQSKAELQVKKECNDVTVEQATKLFDDLKIAISEKLAKMCREEAENLPPIMNKQ